MFCAVNLSPGVVTGTLCSWVTLCDWKRVGIGLEVLKENNGDCSD